MIFSKYDDPQEINSALPHLTQFTKFLHPRYVILTKNVIMIENATSDKLTFCNPFFSLIKLLTKLDQFLNSVYGR